MGLKVVRILKFRHGAPVALWHLGHPAFGIVALLDANGVIKALPEKPVASLSLIRRGHLEVLQRADNGLARSIKQRLFVGAVIDEEGLVLVAGAEVAPQEGENPVFWLNLAAQDAAQLREADKAFEQMDLALEVPDGLENGIQRFVGEIAQKAGPLFQQLDHQVIQVQFLVRKAGEKALLQQLSCVGRTLYDFTKYTVCVIAVCLNGPGRKQRGNKVLIAADRGEDFFVGVTVKDTAEKSVETAIVNIDHFMFHGKDKQTVAPCGGRSFEEKTRNAV